MHDIFVFIVAPLLVGITLKLFDWWLSSHGNDK
ncbi:MAG: type I toxin-antitoxin system Fst family toxin [Lactobacillus sp.]|jgi:hypothetical protein|nr:type I toxin-antitoxin system Fst family toxin [Lactobacillus sp.]MCH3906188.1 type I toxin-antitoxin system Fst family toxin [Lactobacillus sp.]MCH3990235.1 type I toxin-antitoxin system Fst family toxin [Lactobacillus sp.]MCH4069051.1 type I toxin-antitoxin system Fst family toxin [Lactobacillus sp.]MCI1303453.1 type I toxin-antitoxin system Fst family toxin [Lactobacillus sp.]